MGARDAHPATFVKRPRLRRVRELSSPTLERITVDGSDNNKDWLHVTVHRPGADTVISWERIPYAP